MFISVVLPAPFSPRSASTSPAVRAGDGVIGDQRAEALGDPREAQDDVPAPAVHLAHDDFGSLSSISTVKLPSRIAACVRPPAPSASAGTLPSKVPSGASEQPPFFM
jgi:hypothetical protein